MIPHTIEFKDFNESEEVRSAVERRIQKLEHFYDRIENCHVVISRPSKTPGDQRLEIHIQIAIPGDDVVVTRTPEQNTGRSDYFLTIKNAFLAAEKVLKKRVEKMRRYAPQKTQVAVTQLVEEAF